MPSVPVGNEAVVMDGGGLMVKANALLAVAWLTSVTWMVKLKLPAVVGVPLICPVAEFRATPAGRVPAVTLKVKGNVPPVITRVCGPDHHCRAYRRSCLGTGAQTATAAGARDALRPRLTWIGELVRRSS